MFFSRYPEIINFNTLNKTRLTDRLNSFVKYLCIFRSLKKVDSLIKRRSLSFLYITLVYKIFVFLQGQRNLFNINRIEKL